MTRKYNVKHERKRSNYPKRLEARGLAKAPAMTPLDTLRKRAGYIEPAVTSNRRFGIHDALEDFTV
jgi:hypothetical protein